MVKLSSCLTDFLKNAHIWVAFNTTFTFVHRKIPILGKHTKRITCGAWSKGGLLALGSDDKTISVSNADGDTIRQSSLRDTPSDVHFSEMKMDERSRIGEDTVSFVDYYWLPRTSSPQPRPKITTCSQIYKDISGVPNNHIASLAAHNFWSTWNFGFKFLEYRFQLVFYLKLCVKFCPSPKTWGKWQCLTNFISLKKILYAY